MPHYMLSTSRRRAILLPATMATLLVLVATMLLAAWAAPPGEENRFPYWIRPGLRVSYFVQSSSVEISPWAPMTATLSFVRVGTGKWGGNVPVPKPSKSGSVGIAENYVVGNITGQGIEMLFSQWTLNLDLEPIYFEYILLVPYRTPFDGPFWMDPRLLQGVRENDVVNIRHGDRVYPYRVVFAGRYDISPFNTEGEDSLAKKLGAAQIPLPLPKGTYRDIVALQGVLELEGVHGAREKYFHELIVDRETGLIYLEALITRKGGGTPPAGGPLIPAKRSMYLRVLAEINMDLEDRLPSYRAHSYDYSFLAHAGYHVAAAGLLQPQGGATMYSVVAQVEIMVAGVYKNRALFFRNIFLGLQNTPIARIYADLEDLETGETTVYYYLDLASGAQEEVMKTYSQGPLFLGREKLGREEVEFYGNRYGLLGVREAEIQGLGRVKLYAYTSEEQGAILDTLLFADTGNGGVLVALQPGGLQGYQFQPAGKPPNTISYLAALEKTVKASRGKPGWTPKELGKIGVKTSQGAATTTTTTATSTSTTNTTKPSTITSSGGGGGLGYTGIAAGVAVAIVLVALILWARRLRGGAPPAPPPPP